MTAERRWFVRLTDIQAVVLRCTECGMISGYPVQKWQRVPCGCANCSESRMPENTPEHQTLERFRSEFVNAFRDAASLGFEVRLMFDGAPDTP
jgi:hypothetical protein